MTFSWRRLFLYAHVLLAFPLQAADTIGEAQFKANVIYNILLFVQWPERGFVAEGELRLCAMGNSALTPALDQLAGRVLFRRTLVIHHFESGSPLDDIARCDALWVDEDHAAILGRLTLVSRQRPLLLMGEGANATRRGAMIGLVLENGHARLQVDTSAARTAGLTFGARLLRLANSAPDRP